MEEDNITHLSVVSPSIPKMVELAYESYENIQNLAQLMLNQAPEDVHQDLMTTFHTTQTRLMEGLYWFEKAAAIAERASRGVK